MMLAACTNTRSICSKKKLVVLLLFIIVVNAVLYMVPHENITGVVRNIMSIDKFRYHDSEQYPDRSKFSQKVRLIQKLNEKVGKKNSILNNQAHGRIDSLLIRAYGSLETTVDCVGPLYNQSCLYKNIYYKNSTFLVLTVKGRNLPILTVRPDYYPPFDLTPSRLEFESYMQLENFVRNVVNPTVISSLTVYYHQLLQFNIGHALFDGLYPAYMALIRFAPLHFQPFRLLVDAPDCEDCWIIDACRRFAGLGIIRLSVLNSASMRQWFVFESLIMGSGNMCQRCTQPNLQLPGGIKLDGSRLFRNRMYVKHGFLPPLRRQRHSAENRNLQAPLIAYVIHNKRYTAEEKKELNAAITEINTNTDMYLNKAKLTNNMTQVQRPLIRISYLDYDLLAVKKKDSPQFDTARLNYTLPASEQAETKYTAKLRILRGADIYVTGPGTGQLHQIFLPDGSVIINLGGLGWYMHKNKKVGYASFLEEYMTAGIPYIKGLYYPINERWQGIKRNEVIKLVEEAAELISNGFSLPVNPTDNLAADGLLFMEMCERDKDFCTMATVRTVGKELSCNTMWIDEFVHEVNQWNAGGFITEGRNVTCPFNRTLLHELRHKYGINHYVD